VDVFPTVFDMLMFKGRKWPPHPQFYAPELSSGALGISGRNLTRKTTGILRQRVSDMLRYEYDAMFSMHKMPSAASL